VTLDAAANPSACRLGANPALSAALAIAAVAAATLAGAWFFPAGAGYPPCPLCLEQRYAYYLALPLGLLVAFVASKEAPRPVLLAGFALLCSRRWPMPGSAPITPASNGILAGPTDCTGPSAISAAPARCWSGSTP
jgi:hypothetical protein